MTDLDRSPTSKNDESHFLNVLKNAEKLDLVYFVSKLPVPIAIFDSNAVFISTNQMFADIYETDALYLLGKKLNEFSTVVYAHFTDAVTTFNLDTRCDFLENEFYSKGRFYMLYFKVLRNKEKAVESIIVVCANVTKLKRREKVLIQSNKKLHDHLYIDQVTGLKNKLALEEYLANHFNEENKSQFSFIKVDLDDFKKFNRLNSYTLGDEILTEIGEFFSEEILPDENAQLFRMNSASFVVIVQHSTPWQVMTLAERLKLKVYKKKIHYEEFSEDILTVSIGIYHLGIHHQINQMDIMQQLDVAITHAKSLGKNSIFVLE